MCCYVYWGGADICERSHCEKSVTVYNNTAAFYRRHLSWAGAATCIICRDKYFVAKNIFWSQQKFCQGKHTFVMPKDVFFTTNVFGATNTRLA